MCQFVIGGSNLWLLGPISRWLYSKYFMVEFQFICSFFDNFDRTYFWASFSLSSSSLLSLMTVQSSVSEVGFWFWPWPWAWACLAREPLEREAWMWFIFFSTASNVFFDIRRFFFDLLLELPRVLCNKSQLQHKSKSFVSVDIRDGGPGVSQTFALLPIYQALNTADHGLLCRLLMLLMSGLDIR